MQPCNLRWGVPVVPTSLFPFTDLKVLVHVVLLCGYYFPDTVGGTEAYVQMLGRDLKDAGHEVTVVAPDTDDAPRSYEHGGLDVFRYPVSPHPDRAEVQERSSPQYLDVWKDWLGETQPDLVHMHSLTRGCSTFHAQAVCNLGIPLCVTIHVPGVTCPRGTMMRWGSTPCDGEVRATRCGACVLQEEGLLRPVAWGIGALSSTGIGRVAPGRLRSVFDRGRIIEHRKQRMQNWLRSANHVVVVAGWLKDVLRRNDIGPEHVTVSRHGLSDEMRSMQKAAAHRRGAHDSTKPLCVGFVGRFTEVKGIHVLVDAVCRLPSAVDVKARLYGMAQSESDEQYLAGLKEKTRDEPRVQFCGPMTDENRADAFASFDVLAVPSTWQETGPYTVLEAFAADVPVLGSNHSGIRERVDDGSSGRLVPAGDPEAWAQALQELYHRHRSGNWSWDLPAPRTSKDVAREMIRLYRHA